MKIKKQIHFSCNNCKKYSNIKFQNNVYFCFGIVNKPNPSCDYFRSCIIKDKTKHIVDLMLEEVFTYLYGLSSILVYLLKDYRIKVNKREI